MLYPDSEPPKDAMKEMNNFFIFITIMTILSIIVILGRL